MSDETLHIAASAGDFETSKMLIESGMDVNALDIEGGYVMNVDFHFQFLNTFLNTYVYPHPPPFFFSKKDGVLSTRVARLVHLS